MFQNGRLYQYLYSIDHLEMYKTQLYEPLESWQHNLIFGLMLLNSPKASHSKPFGMLHLNPSAIQSGHKKSVSSADLTLTGKSISVEELRFDAIKCLHHIISI